MKFITVQEGQRGLRFHKGRFEGVLLPGRRLCRPGDKVLMATVGDGWVNPDSLRASEGNRWLKAKIEDLLRCPDFQGQVETVTVEEGEVVLHSLNGVFTRSLDAGVHAFWKDAGAHTFRRYDMRDPEPVQDLPERFLAQADGRVLKINVAEYEKARLFRNGKLDKVLDAGLYSFWNYACDLRVSKADMRLTQMNIVGQELLTSDKVSLRVSFVVDYRVADCVRVLTEVEDFKMQLHVAGQLALREYVAARRLDEVLDGRAGMTEFVLERLQTRGKGLHVEVLDAGVKDITLPGAVRDIMNTVLVAEKRAQANVITRREEVASTRSLLNTARLMDENKTLYKLKELEVLEKICENVGSLTVGGGDLLGQLTAILRGGERSA